MPSAHAAMDGGKSCPQHEHQQAGDALYSVPAFRSQLAMPAMEVRALQQHEAALGVSPEGVWARQPSSGASSRRVFAGAVYQTF